MLIDKGAKINALNEDGFSALDYAFNATEGNIKNSCNFNFNREQKKKRLDKAMEKKINVYRFKSYTNLHSLLFFSRP